MVLLCINSHLKKMLFFNINVYFGVLQVQLMNNKKDSNSQKQIIVIIIMIKKENS